MEHWFIATNDDVRTAFIAHFSTEVTADDLRAIGEVVGASAELPALWDATFKEPLELGPLQIPGPDAPPNAVAFRSVPSSQAFVMMEPPGDSTRAALWNAIEPSRR